MNLTGVASLKRMLGIGNSSGLDGSNDSQAYRVYVNPVGLTPWMWGGMRGEVFAVVFASAVLGFGVFHLWLTTPVLLVIELYYGRKLTQWHPYWPEMVLRHVLQPIGYLDT